MNSNINPQKLKTVMELIDKIADSDSINDIAVLESELKEITGKNELCAEDCFEYWSWTSLEELAQMFLMPAPKKHGLSDNKLSEIVKKICECEYSESEMDYQLKVMEKETGLTNVSDYIFYPDEIGLSTGAESDEIITKILMDRKS